MYAFFGSDSFPPHHRIDLSEVDADVTVLGSEDDASFGHSVASGDFNGDGLDDMCGGEYGHDGIAHSGVGAAFTVWGRDDFPKGAVIDLRDEPADLSFIGEDIYDCALGLFVSAGDLDGDGYDEIIAGPGPGPYHPATVRVLDEAGAPLWQFQAYGTPRYGVNLASGDLDGDGDEEIVTGPGPSELFGAHVRGWNCDGGSVTSIPGVNFFAFSGTSHAMGCVVACGDLDNDHIDEILTVPGPHPDNPASLKSWNYDGDELTQIDRMSFLLFEEGEYVAGARLAFGNFYQEPPFLP